MLCQQLLQGRQVAADVYQCKRLKLFEVAELLEAEEVQVDTSEGEALEGPKFDVEMCGDWAVDGGSLADGEVCSSNQSVGQSVRAVNAFIVVKLKHSLQSCMACHTIHTKNRQR